MSEESQFVLYSADMTREVADCINEFCGNIKCISDKLVLIGAILGHPLEDGSFQIGIIPIAEHDRTELAKLLIALGLKMLDIPVQSGGKPS